MDDEDIFDVARRDQARAGLRDIAQTIADFRDALIEFGFERDETTHLCRELLISLMEHTDFDAEEDEDE